MAVNSKLCRLWCAVMIARVGTNGGGLQWVCEQNQDLSSLSSKKKIYHRNRARSNHTRRVERAVCVSGVGQSEASRVSNHARHVEWATAWSAPMVRWGNQCHSVVAVTSQRSSTSPVVARESWSSRIQNVSEHGFIF